MQFNGEVWPSAEITRRTSSMLVTGFSASGPRYLSNSYADITYYSDVLCESTEDVGRCIWMCATRAKLALGALISIRLNTERRSDLRVVNSSSPARQPAVQGSEKNRPRAGLCVHVSDVADRVQRVQRNLPSGPAQPSRDLHKMMVPKFPAHNLTRIC